MSNRRRIKVLEDNVATAKQATRRLDLLIANVEHELRCEHTFFLWDQSNIAGCCVAYRKKCLNCGKILESYKNKAEWLDAQYKEVPEREKRARDIIDPFPGMDERTRQLAEDYVVCLKKNVMDEKKARAVIGDNITKGNIIANIVDSNRGLGPNIRWEPGCELIRIDNAGLTVDQLKAFAWWMENKGEKKP